MLLKIIISLPRYRVQPQYIFIKIAVSIISKNEDSLKYVFLKQITYKNHYTLTAVLLYIPNKPSLLYLSSTIEYSTIEYSNSYALIFVLIFRFRSVWEDIALYICF